MSQFPNSSRPKGIGSPTGDTFLSVRDVATRLAVAERTVWRWIKSGALRAHRIGKVVRISAEDFAAFMAIHRVSW
jgi:excisionase family DNA binding protein